VLGNFLIGLREGLEAGLVVSILLAYVVKTGRRHLLGRVWLGVALAVTISLAFGALLTFGPRGLSFAAQELLGGTLSILAVGLVTWMIFWMAGASRTIAGDLRRQVDAAEGNSWSLTLIAALAVGREGLETALFLWAASKAAAAETGSSTGPLLAAIAGLLVSAALAYALYAGAVRINLGRFFAATGFFLIVVAAGVLSYGLHDLQEAGVIPGLNRVAFDISAAVPPGSVAGAVLKGVFNFSPTPSILECVAWVAYVGVVGTLFIRKVRHKTHAGTKPAGEPVAATS